jgi:hypothetical protein
MHLSGRSSFEHCYHRAMTGCTPGFLLYGLPALTLVFVHKVAVRASIQGSAVDLKHEIVVQLLPSKRFMFQ